MFTLNTKKIFQILMFTAMFSPIAFAATNENTTAATVPNDQKMEQEFDALGGNGVLLEKARALNPEVHATVVQNRIVDRTFRFELGLNYDNTFGGDTYVRTGTFGLNGRFHFSNLFAIGAKYGNSYNKLTDEGEAMVDRATAEHNADPMNADAPVPSVDYPKNSTMGFVEFYPLFGKMSWLGKGITHFDIYAQLGYGTITLKTDSKSIPAGALGVSIWGGENLTARLEVNYMEYKAKNFKEEEANQRITSLGIQAGWLF